MWSKLLITTMSAGALALLSACNAFDYHPYDTNIHGRTNINEDGMHSIEALNLQPPFKFAFLTDTQGALDETLQAIDIIRSRDAIWAEKSRFTGNCPHAISTSARRSNHLPYRSIRFSRSPSAHPTPSDRAPRQQHTSHRRTKSPSNSLIISCQRGISCCLTRIRTRTGRTKNCSATITP